MPIYLDGRSTLEFYTRFGRVEVMRTTSKLIICGSLALTAALSSIASVCADSWRADDRDRELLRQDNKVYGSGVRIEIKLLTSKQHPRITPTDRATLQKVIDRRLTELEIEKPTFQIDRDGKLIITIDKLERSIEPAMLGRTLAATGRLEMRAQKIGTQRQLASALVKLNLLKDRRSSLAKSPHKSAIAINQSEIKKQNEVISRLFDRATITNKDIANAVLEPNMSISTASMADILAGSPQPTGRWDILLEFDPAGGDAFAILTKKLAGSERAIGIFVDGEPISTPMVSAAYSKSGITDGKAVIGGNFTAASATALARQIRSGVLPVSIEIVRIQQLPAR